MTERKSEKKKQRAKLTSFLNKRKKAGECQRGKVEVNIASRQSLLEWLIIYWCRKRLIFFIYILTFDVTVRRIRGKSFENCENIFLITNDCTFFSLVFFKIQYQCLYNWSIAILFKRSIIRSIWIIERLEANTMFQLVFHNLVTQKNIPINPNCCWLVE